MANRRFLITGALPYSNGRLHVGHIAGAYLPADIYVRYLRAAGDEVRFICGSDDNGVAALKTAREEGTTVEELTARFNRSQRESFAGLGIVFDVYGGTHQPGFTEIHERLSQDLFRRIYQKDYFVKKTTKQLYDVEAKQFLPDRFVQGTCIHCKSPNAYGDQCEDCGRSLDALDLIDPKSTMTGTKPELRETVHWYLRLDRLQKRLAEWLRTKQRNAPLSPAWRPATVNFSLGQIENEGLPERCMTRDLDWGVPVPLDDPDAEGKVLYVWFDAPIGYVSFTAKDCEDRGEGWQAYERWWKDPDCRVVHFIGEDNTIFHAITWPAMLLASHDSDSTQGQAGEYQLPATVCVNAFLNIKFPGKEEEKISKSRGTAIWIEEYLTRFAPDPLRYYLTAIAPERQRTAFDLEDFIQRNNSELLAKLGNLVNRTLTFAKKYFDGNVPDPGDRQEVDLAQLAARQAAGDKVADHIEHFRFRAGLEAAMELASKGNEYFDVTAPYRTRKTDLAECGRAVNVCIQTVRSLATIIGPFLPFTARSILQQLAIDDDALAWSRLAEEITPGHALGEPTYLFRKIEPEELDSEQ
ncbi:MAG: methionine--tRNA ligase [Phycisphaerae bacterium]|nr:methionine--tRNA ligase [Phycisphaerae bacterium]